MVAINFAPPPVSPPGGVVDPNEIARREAIARALQEQSAGMQDIQSPWQGVNQVAQAVVGGLGAQRASQERASNQQLLAEILSGTGDSGAVSQDKLAILYALDPELGMSIAQQQKAQASEAAERQRAAEALSAMGMTQQAEAVKSGVLSLDDASNMLMKGWETPEQSSPTLTSIYDENGREQKGYMQGDQFIPVGSPKASTERPEFTVSQATAAGYADRMIQADAVLSNPKLATVQTDITEQRGALPLVGNFIASPEFQQADQAQRDFINAILRRESGAVISDSEFSNARRQYFPQPGDSEAVLRQKAANRQNAITGVVRAAGTAYQRPDTTNYLDPTPESEGMGAAPVPGAVEDGYRFKGGDPADPNNWEPI